MTANDPTPGTRPAPAAGFLATLRRAGLLTEAESAQALTLLRAAPPSAEAAARTLTGAGLLTPFQARRLLAGKSDGLALGQYVILDELARGHGHRVYKARHRTMDRLVAVRVLAAEATGDPGRLAAARAHAEAQARAAARLAHPNVLTVLDFNEAAGRLYVVLEYVDAVPPEALAGQTRDLPTSRACEIVRQAALGMHHAHELGVAHGHFHPGSLLVGRPGAAVGSGSGRVEVKVADFGTPPDAAAEPGATNPLLYRAPELIPPGPRPSVASDLYSLGAVLYELLTGRPPFDAPATRPRPVPPARAVRPTLPPAVEALLQSMLAHNPSRRPASAAEVAARLEPFAEAHDAAPVIDFDLPARAAQPSLAGQVSGGYLSGLVADPGPRADTSLDDTSPWYGLGSDATVDAQPTPAPPAPAAPACTRRTAIALAAGCALGALIALAAAGVLAAVVAR